MSEFILDREPRWPSPSRCDLVEETLTSSTEEQAWHPREGLCDRRCYGWVLRSMEEIPSNEVMLVEHALCPWPPPDERS